MSASLVGSEMCIRDRLSAFHRCLRWPFERVGPAARATSFYFSEPSKTVSYTHLTLPTICSV
eukprot:13614258-Alexandrium_andersonii.AAC.1